MAAFSVTGLVLAGGLSQRMGQDKRFLPYNDVSFLERALENARAVSDEVWILTSTEADKVRLPQVMDDDVRVRSDRVPGGGPMAALAGALPEVSTDMVLLLAVDTPLVSTDFLSRLISHVSGLEPRPHLVVPDADGAWQMTCALYDAELRTSIVGAVDRDQRSLRHWASTFPADAIHVISEETWQAWGPPDVFTNVNTPADYERLKTGRGTHRP